jgi:hypothetical protein
MSTQTLNLSSNSVIYWLILVSAVKVLCFFFMMVCIFSLIREGFLRSPNRAYRFISHWPDWCSCNTADLYVGCTSFASQQGQELPMVFSWFSGSLKENPSQYLHQVTSSNPVIRRYIVREADATVKWATYKNACRSKFFLRKIPPYLIQSVWLLFKEVL